MTVKNFNKLTPEEERVIVYKGTERPFSGEYEHHFQPGTYVCRRCEAPLYRSESKFDAGCGWPSFDDEIKGAVRRLPDPDGERFTNKDTRHCVNSISLKFIPEKGK